MARLVSLVNRIPSHFEVGRYASKDLSNIELHFEEYCCNWIETDLNGCIYVIYICETDDLRPKATSARLSVQIYGIHICQLHDCAQYLLANESAFICPGRTIFNLDIIWYRDDPEQILLKARPREGEQVYALYTSNWSIGPINWSWDELQRWLIMSIWIQNCVVGRRTSLYLSCHRGSAANTQDKNIVRTLYTLRHAPDKFETLVYSENSPSKAYVMSF